ncbi:MAG: hypothetical protein ACRES7_08820 [Gammaproteobacteria bacterium]
MKAVEANAKENEYFDEQKDKNNILPILRDRAQRRLPEIGGFGGGDRMMTTERAHASPTAYPPKVSSKSGMVHLRLEFIIHCERTRDAPGLITATFVEKNP